MKKEISTVVLEAKSLHIGSAADMKGATEVLSRINRQRDLLKEEKNGKLSPLKAKIDKIKERYDEPETALEAAAKLITRGMAEYHAFEISERAKKTALLADKVSKGEVDIGDAVVDMADRPEKRVEAMSGAVSFVTVKKHEVMDMTLLPIEYHYPNDVLIRKEMLAGKQLPGVRYFEEQSVRNNRNA